MAEKRLTSPGSPSLTAFDRNPPLLRTINSSCSSLHEMPRMRKLRMLVAANGQRDVAYAQAIAVRLLKDSQIETRALVDEVPLRLTHEIMVMENRSLATVAIDADQRTRDAIEAARQTAFDLVEWADLLVLAPIDADHLAKMMSGIADTTLLEVLRAWDVSKKILLVPGMSVQMWEHPMTKKQLSKIKRKWNWIKVMTPVLWHYDGAGNGKRVVSWDGFNDLVGIIKNQAELMSLGHDVEVAAKQAMHTISPHRVAKTLPPEIWSLIFQHVGDWEIASALNIYTRLDPPADWNKNRASLTDPIDLYMYDLEWLILSCPGSDVICQKLSEAPKGLRYVSSLVVKLIMKFSLIDVLTYLETHLSKVFWASFSAKFLPNKASGIYGRVDILAWWNTSPSFLKKEYDAEALDNASRMGYVHVLDWWLHSGLPLKFTEAALDTDRRQCSAGGQAQAQTQVRHSQVHVTDHNPLANFASQATQITQQDMMWRPQSSGGNTWHDWTAAVVDSQDHYSASALMSLGNANSHRPSGSILDGGAVNGMAVGTMSMNNPTMTTSAQMQWPLLLFSDGVGGV
ncbi:hypothetical protein O1611_g4708 [Lasiodiplodia mahajangana]|uniref:Uncharacterized protein n=1 Tax=Lasiodiplodia mahajangana TaxID=1108764 RepID=A0ACC2JN79_9PEZI|nr:hypothetical protein O1611_g4708 [Lasiodiplodia mahajangana]